MGATIAHYTTKGRNNYGRNTSRGLSAERRVISVLRRRGYRVFRNNSGGFADLIAFKGGRRKLIQVKSISSRRFLTEKAAERRIRGKPFNVRIPSGGEVWIYDADGDLYIVRGRS